jgi:hypothetical protein
MPRPHQPDPLNGLVAQHDRSQAARLLLGDYRDRRRALVATAATASSNGIGLFGACDCSSIQTVAPNVWCCAIRRALDAYRNRDTADPETWPREM